MQICSWNAGREFIEKPAKVLQVPVVLKTGPNLRPRFFTPNLILKIFFVITLYFFVITLYY